MLRVLNRLQALRLSVWLFLRRMTAIKCLSETVLRRRKLGGLSFFCVTGLQRASKVLISFPSFLSSAPRRERLMMPDVLIKLAKRRFHSSISADRYNGITTSVNVLQLHRGESSNSRRFTTSASFSIPTTGGGRQTRLLSFFIFQIATLATVPVRYR